MRDRDAGRPTTPAACGGLPPAPPAPAARGGGPVISPAPAAEAGSGRRTADDSRRVRRSASRPHGPCEERTVTATYTVDVFCTLDGFGSYDENGDWGGYWGKDGPEFLDRRLAAYGEGQRMVLGAATFRMFVQMLGPLAAAGELDPVNTRMRDMPTTGGSTPLGRPVA